MKSLNALNGSYSVWLKWCFFPHFLVSLKNATWKRISAINVSRSWLSVDPAFRWSVGHTTSSQSTGGGGSYRAHSMMMVKNSLNSLGLFQTRPKKMVDKPYSRTYTQPRAVYCQAFNRHLAPGGAERRRLCSMVVSGGSGAAVTKSLEGKGAQVPREGDVFFCQDSQTVMERFLGSVFLVGEKHLELERKRTLRGLSEFDCKGMNVFAVCCES